MPLFALSRICVICVICGRICRFFFGRRATGRELKRFGASRDWRDFKFDCYCNATFHPGGRWIVSGNHDGTVSIYDAAGAEPPRTLRGHTRWVHPVAVSPEGDRIASASHDGTIRLWDFASGAGIVTLQCRGEPFYPVAFSRDGQKIAGLDGFSGIMVWDSGPWEDDAPAPTH